MNYQLATVTDIPDILNLLSKFHIKSVSDEDKTDGFVTTELNESLLKELITSEDSFVIARDGDTLAGFIMSASWEYCSKWPIFQFMIDSLQEIEYLGGPITTSNSYQYGPICVDKPYRGTGVMEGMFDYAREVMSHRYPIMVTFVNKANPRSVNAHVNKLNMEVVREFHYNGNSYIEIVYDTSKSLFS